MTEGPAGDAGPSMYDAIGALAQANRALQEQVSEHTSHLSQVGTLVDEHGGLLHRVTDEVTNLQERMSQANATYTADREAAEVVQSTVTAMATSWSAQGLDNIRESLVEAIRAVERKADARYATLAARIWIMLGVLVFVTGVLVGVVVTR